jgi:hypothetical protein
MSHRIIAVIAADERRRLSQPAWTRFAIRFPTSIPAAVELLAVEPGGVLLLDPALSNHACEVLLAAATSVGTDVVLYATWSDSIVQRIVEVLRHTLPLDLVFTERDDDVARLAAIFASPYGLSVPAITLKELGPQLSRLSWGEQTAVVAAFFAPHAAQNIAQLIASRRVVLRTFERHAARAGLASPRDILRGAGVARSRNILVGETVSLAIAAERSGLHSEAGLIDAYHWAVQMPPRLAARSLAPRDFANRLATSLLGPGK